MDSVLQWKQEPVSPLNEVYLDSDDTFYQIIDDVKFETDLQACETKAEVASHILENLENLMDLDDLIKDEPFLLDEKILPMLEAVDAPRAVPVPLVPGHHVKSEYSLDQKAHQSTQSLLQEFETVYGGMGALTPPQSPPAHLTTLEPLLKQAYHAPDAHCFKSSTMCDVEHELAMVEELVRSRAADLQWQETSPPYPSSPGSSEGSSSGSEDPEWVPEPVEGNSGPSSPKRRSKPYARAHPDEKKSRKKEQNKNAATRYRMKKKAEVEVILSEEKVLLDHSVELGAKVTDLQREIKYLKGLMRDLFKAKGLIN